MAAKAKLIKAPRGVTDILPEEIPLWRWLEEAFRQELELAGFSEIRLPIFEATELFTRSIGQETDIVSKEMYSFSDAGGRSFSLRPEGTAPLVRAFLEHGFSRRGGVCRLYYLGPMFRAERPQAGRFRQFHQLGAEVLGAASPLVDVELLALVMRVLKGRLKVEGAFLEINSLGCRICRPGFRKALQDSLASVREELCPDCQRRVEMNPLRVLDCKREGCWAVLAKAPSGEEYMCANCREHFAFVREGLEVLEVDYHLNPRLVRGLDYYTRTAFEVVCPQLGAQNAVAGGGRYDDLVELLGGPATPAFGFAVGFERLAMVVRQELAPGIRRPEVFLVLLGEAARRKGLRLLDALRQAGLGCVLDYEGRSLKKQLQRAGKSGARWALILGEDELARGEVVCKDLVSGEQQRVGLDRVVEYLCALGKTCGFA